MTESTNIVRMKTNHIAVDFMVRIYFGLILKHEMVTCFHNYSNYSSKSTQKKRNLQFKMNLLPGFRYRISTVAILSIEIPLDTHGQFW